jgi:hypothetical protein
MNMNRRRGWTTSVDNTGQRHWHPPEPDNHDKLIAAIADALYPILIPVEPQDCAIQAKNQARINSLAKRVYEEWI